MINYTDNEDILTEQENNWWVTKFKYPRKIAQLKDAKK